MLEKLESRTLFTVLPLLTPPPPILPPSETEPFYVEGTTLRINGSDGADTIEVRDDRANWVVSRNAETRTYPRYTFTRILMYGYGGDDNLRMISTALVPVTLDGGGGRDQLQGGVRGDLLNGGGGDDQLRGNDGNDVLNGGFGNDTSFGGAGADIFNGGDDRDEVSYDDGYLRVVGITARFSNTLTSGAPGEGDIMSTDNEVLRGSIFNDTLYSIGGRALYGGGGNDNLWGSASNDFLAGGPGNDFLYGQLGNDLLFGDDGDDMLWGMEGLDELHGGVNNDQIRGGPDNDTAFGDAGNDRIWGDGGRDWLAGNQGNDAIYGGADNDMMYGSEGDDVLVSIGGGADFVSGGGNFDSFWVDEEEVDGAVDADAAELAKLTVHRVRRFENPVSFSGGVFTYSKELDGQDILDPYETQFAPIKQNFALKPLFTAAGPTQDDVIQGDVGDCWLVATLAAVAKTEPEFIRQSIVSLGDGTFGVRLWGRYFRVDADLAMFSKMYDDGTVYAYQPRFAGFGNAGPGWNPVDTGMGMNAGALWAALMEKAMVHNFDPETPEHPYGRYHLLDGDFPRRAFGAMHPAALSEKDDFDNGTDMLNWIQAQLDDHRAVVVCTPEDEPIAANVVGDHCYTVDSIFTDEMGRRFLRVRNPWGYDGTTVMDDGNDGYVLLTAGQAFDSFDLANSARMY